MSNYLMNSLLAPVPFRNIDNEFRRFFEETPRTFVPAADVEEHDGEYRFTVSLPGLDKKDIKIEVLEDQITVRGERAQRTDEGGRNHLSEIVYGSFARTFTLPTHVSEAGVTAKFENGLLHLTVPKSAVSKARTIEIQ